MFLLSDRHSSRPAGELHSDVNARHKKKKKRLTAKKSTECLES